MSTSLSDAINQVIGVPGGTSGFRWAVNHSDTSAPGVTAPHQLTLYRKVEAPPILFMDDATNNYPGVFFEIVGPFPDTQTRGIHGEMTFTVRIYIVQANTNSTRPKEEGRAAAIALTENIKATDRLALTWPDSVEWLGLVDDPFTQQLHLALRDWCAGCTMFRVTARGLTW